MEITQKERARLKKILKSGENQGAESLYQIAWVFFGFAVVLVPLGLVLDIYGIRLGLKHTNPGHPIFGVVFVFLALWFRERALLLKAVQKLKALDPSLFE